VFDLRPSDFDREFDVVVASPPCTQFSLAVSSLERIVDAEPQTDDASDAVALVYHTLGLIRGLSPSYWFLENPQGFLRQIIGDPTARVTYCQYGTDYMKPTDLWGTHPAGWIPRSCSYGDGCHAYNTDRDHGGEGNVRTMFQSRRVGRTPPNAQRSRMSCRHRYATRANAPSMATPLSTPTYTTGKRRRRWFDDRRPARLSRL